MNNHIDNMNAAFEEAAKKVIFKGSALENIKHIARESMRNVIQDYEQRIAKLQSEATARTNDLSNKVDDQVASNAKTSEQVLYLQNKIERITTSSNKERKSAVARANRYKAKYEKLLDDLEFILPGSKELITNKAISIQEKEQRILKLDSQIEKYMKQADSKTFYDPDKMRDVHLPGYGEACRILESLRAKKKQLKNKICY